MNVYQKLMDIIIAVTLFFLIPAMCFMKLSDQFFRSIAYDYTRRLGYEIETHGYISKDMYENYINSLTFMDSLYEVCIEHTQTIFEPVYKKNSNNSSFLFTDEVISFEEKTFTEEIVKNIYGTEDSYKMEKGDLYKVTLISTSKGILERLLFSIGYQGSDCYATYSGVIRSHKLKK